MPLDPKHPNVGDMSIDATDVTVAPADGTKRKQLTKLRKGYTSALAVLTGAPAAMLQRAGIDVNEVNAAATAAANAKRIEDLLPAAKYLYTSLLATYLVNRSQVAAVLADAGASAKRRAKRDAKGFEILAAFEGLLDYTEGPAKKGVATKIKDGTLKPQTAKSKSKTSTATTTAAAPATTPAKTTAA